MNLSKYNIYLPLNNQKEDYLFIQGYTGAIDVVSKDIYETISKSKNDYKKLDELSKENFQILKNRGYITNKNENDERDLMLKIAKVIHKIQSRNVSIVIIPSYNCNFGCPYCFENTLSKYGENWANKVMNKDTVDSIFRFIDKLIISGKNVSSITLFGGEPLLKKNLNIVKYIVNKCLEKNLKVKAVSNGYDLNYFQNLLSKNMISEIQITIDGIGHEHDRRRFLRCGGPSFDKIVKNINLALDKNINITVRTNIDTNNINNIDKIREFFDKEGWTKKDNFHNYFKCVHQCYIKNKNKITDVEIMKKLSNKINSIDKFRLNSTYMSIMSAFLQVFKTGGYSPIRGGYCGGTLGMFVFDVFNDIYSCWEVSGQEDKIIGNLKSDGSITYNKNANMWRNRVIGNIKECKDCRYALFCAGGCPAHAKVANGDINTAYCENFIEIFNEVIPKIYKYYFEKERVLI